MPARLPPRLALGGEQAAAAPPREVVHVLLPRGQRRRHALARQQVRDQGPQRGEPRVAAGVQRPVARQRREVGEVGAHRVEHGQRAVGAADRDVDVEAEHHLPLDRPRVGRLERVVAGEVAQRALGGGERMHARAGQARPARDPGGELAAGRGERPAAWSMSRTPATRSRSGRRPAPRAATRARRAPRARARPPAAGRACRVEHHQLLLDADVWSVTPSKSARSVAGPRHGSRYPGGVRAARREVQRGMRLPGRALIGGGGAGRLARAVRADLRTGMGIPGLTARAGARPRRSTARSPRAVVHQRRGCAGSSHRRPIPVLRDAIDGGAGVDDGREFLRRSDERRRSRRGRGCSCTRASPARGDRAPARAREAARRRRGEPRPRGARAAGLPAARSPSSRVSGSRGRGRRSAGARTRA